MRPRSLATDLHDELQAAVTRRYASQWPDAAWQKDILGFCRHHFGIEPWSQQAAVLTAIQDGDRVAVASGRKIGKSFLVAAAALWYFSSFEDARVILMAPTFRQVDTIVWREIRKLFKLARRRGTPLDGHLLVRASSGLRADDEREIRGFTADAAEDAAGISGVNMFFIFDESSGIDDQIYGAMIGNLAAGGKIAAMSNPTQTAGWFFDCFHDGKAFWRTFNVSSEDSPNVVAGRVVVKGLARAEWIAEMRGQYGADSAFYRMHVLGQFALGEERRIVELAVVKAAIERYATTPAEGRLVIGLDPAEKRDDSAFAAVRGRRALRFWLHRRLSPDDHVRELAKIIGELRQGREPVTVVIDREGEVGNAVFGTLRTFAESMDFILVGVRSSETTRTKPKQYERIKDDLWSVLARWLQTGAIPNDPRLIQELTCPDWIRSESGVYRTTPKEKMRAILGHSPDMADALALAIWTPVREEYAPETPERDQPRRRRAVPRYDDEAPVGGMNPYAALDVWR